ncbi:uncharacterized protein HMPREF1541_04656 [Cyphellophora europaea CBS 101466]|uniref:NADPH-dependent diflavin oxidoreductase 1 n=1 Tax=Cyphellophora europaea (strain CBS 101466) TaxID=1220924 RepID=W2RXJ5_CYPE1|nr:uncharacterized protein HMPREF1541_04656 [Cyphellophora europaea CBS 101466]ETN40379.1 hypothetical protein HMPREF1541_04656 [Cyphellophora europaea CBS 101466]
MATLATPPDPSPSPSPSPSPTTSNSDRSALILYGTETGTSQDLAHELSRTLTRLRFSPVDVLALDDLITSTSTSTSPSSYSSIQTLLQTYTLTLITLSTTGQGDFPNNARKFWQFLLRRKLGPTTLHGVNYALVGLGDSSYLKFNWAARKLGKRLGQLGARAVVEACEADEQGDEGVEGSYLQWVAGLRDRVLELWPLSEGVEVLGEEVEVQERWKLGVGVRQSAGANGFSHVNGAGVNGRGGKEQQAGPPMADSFPAVLEVNDRATPASHWQDVRFMKLRASGQHDYLPGDAIAVMPENMAEDVETLIKQLKWDDVADVPLTLQSNTAPAVGRPSLQKPPLDLEPGQQITLRTLLTKYLDINAIPRRSFFATIARYTSDEMHRERLLEFTDPQYLDEYFDYATRPRRGIIEVLQEFDTVHIPWEQCINIFPMLRARQFSIASAYHDTPSGETVFELLIAIVKYRTVIKRIRQGVCTRYLAKLPVGTELRVALRREGRIADRSEIAETNHILIGAGTGLAPLRALVHEKELRSLGRSSTMLIFGCRNRDSDYFFSEEWASTTARWPRFQLVPAFSRDQATKVYVQDQIRDHGETIASMMQDGRTVVIVCGASGQMPKAVRQALIDVLAQNGQWRMLPEEAEEYVADMEKRGRYKQETWS